MIPSTIRISDRSRTNFDTAEIKLTGQFDRRPIGRYIELCYNFLLFLNIFIHRRVRFWQ